MTVTAVNITQDNIVSGVNLLSVHNPLVFIAGAEWTGTPPDFLTGQIDGVDYKATYYREETASNRSFIFVTDEIIRSIMSDIEDTAQTTGTVIAISNMTTDVTVTMTDLDSTQSDSVDIIACHASNDFESEYGAAMFDRYNNASNFYVMAKGQKGYLYWYNDDAANPIKKDASDTPFTLAKGFIRKAIEPTETGLQEESIIIDGVTYTHNVYVREFCDNSIYLRYIDRDGQYRFMPFNQYHKRSSNPELIGEVDNLVLSLKDDTGDKKQIGYKNSDTLTVQAINLTSDELALMKDLYNSFDVQINVNNKWVKVKVRGDNVSKKFKGKFTDVTIDLILPQSYNVTSL
jgi:hypothetical protein